MICARSPGRGTARPCSRQVVTRIGRQSSPCLPGTAAARARDALLPAGLNTVMSLVPLPGGDLLVASADPWLARLAPDGTPRWRHGPPAADFRDQFDRLSVSADGTRIGFGFQAFGKSPARFDLATRTLTAGARHRRRAGRPAPDRLAGRKLAEPIQPDAWRQAAAAGSRMKPPAASRSIRTATASCWGRSGPCVPSTRTARRSGPAPRPAWSGPSTSPATAGWLSRPMATAPSAGTGCRTGWNCSPSCRWLTRPTGSPGRRRASTQRPPAPRACCAGTSTAAGTPPPTACRSPTSLGPTAPPCCHSFCRNSKHRARSAWPLWRSTAGRSCCAPTARFRPVRGCICLPSASAPTTRTTRRSLRLHYADRDAHDLASAIVNTQGSLYQVQPQVLLDKDANKPGILRALKVMRAGMEAGAGARSRGGPFLRPWRDGGRQTVSAALRGRCTRRAGIKASGLSADDLRGELLELAKYGRVLVLLDACHSGATTMNGAGIAIDADALRTGLAAANVTVLTSSKGSETSRGARHLAAWRLHQGAAGCVQRSGGGHQPQRADQHHRPGELPCQARADIDGGAADAGDGGPVRHDAVRQRGAADNCG